MTDYVTCSIHGRHRANSPAADGYCPGVDPPADEEFLGFGIWHPAQDDPPDYDDPDSVHYQFWPEEDEDPTAGFLYESCRDRIR